MTDTAKDTDNFRVLADNAREMGCNYLIDGTVVYCISLWVQGGECFRSIYHPGDDGYEAQYRSAALNQNTLFRTGDRR